MCPWLWTNLWISLWISLWMEAARVGTEALWAPYVEMGPGFYGPAGAPSGPTEAQVEYAVGELREDLDLQGVQGIIDEGGRR